MNRIVRVILVCAFFLALPLAAENLTQCIINCPPGVNSCSQCCLNQFDAATGPCYAACQSAQQACFNAAWQSCQGSVNPQVCYQQAMVPCMQAAFSCQRTCDSTVQIAGGCPGEVPPQKCPYNCQMWNPASQSCIGPAMNGCNLPAAAAAPDVYAERAKAAADAAAAYTQKLQDETKAKTKAKNKKK
jgi:hypothetical protein